MTLGGIACWPLGLTWMSEAIGHNDMRRMNLFYFFSFGVQTGQFSATFFSPLPLSNWRINAAMKEMNNWLAAFSAPGFEDFPKSRLAGRKYLAILSPFVNDVSTDRVLTKDEWTSLMFAQQDFIQVLKDEIGDSFVFMVTPIGAYSTKSLVEESEHHLSGLAQKTITEKTREDFRLAGYCLALDMWTASGFHALRALESEARVYHKIVTGVELKESPLGALINGDNRVKNSGLKPHFEKMGSPTDDPLGLIISMMAHINKIYRCPVMHPEMTLDKETAKQMFDISATAISAIVDDSHQRLQAKTATGNP